MSTFFEKLKMGMGIDGEQEQELEKSPEEEKPVEKPKKPRAKKEKLAKSRLSEEKEKTEENPPKEIEVKEKQEPEEKMAVKEPSKVNQDKEAFDTFDKLSASTTQGKKNIMNQKEESKETISPEKEQPSGQLAVDVYQTEGYLVIQSAIAGVKADDLDITMEGDMVSIRGTREKPSEENERNYFYQECYWGPFSRQILLSVEVDPSRAEASMKEGILSIKIPKIEKDKKRKLVVKE